jgi:hypothetical protein
MVGLNVIIPMVVNLGLNVHIKMVYGMVYINLIIQVEKFTLWINTKKELDMEWWLNLKY